MSAMAGSAETHTGRDEDRLPEATDAERHDVADDGPLSTLPIIGRRRPAGGPRPVVTGIGPTGWLWMLAGLAVLAVWVSLFRTGRPAPVLERMDAALLDWIVARRADPATSIARGIALLGSVGFILAARWSTVIALAVFRRGRALVVLVLALLVVRIAIALLVDAIARPRPWGVAYLYGWQGYAHPSPQVAALAVTLTGAGYALVPAGRRRAAAMLAAGTCVALLVLARVYLGIDHPSDGVLGAVGGAAVAVVAFRAFSPDDVFPVRFDRSRAAHLDVDERREQAIREALDEQAGLELLGVEPFGADGSGASTPLRLDVRRSKDGRRETLFAKLYSSNHLRADRWYKLSRTILYGELEDERAFESVRRLVEYEDYMLRVMRDAGVRGVEARGFVEVEPDREYLLLMTFLERVAETDEDAELSDAAIDDGLRAIRELWDHGLAHRDIKPANVLVRDDQVFIIDVAFGQMRASPWRQVVDLANMMLVLALASDAGRVYDRATRMFEPDEIGEAFGAARGPAIPRQLREKLGERDDDLVETFRRLAPEHDPIAIQRWSVRRLVLTVRTVVVGTAVLALLLVNLADVGTP
jgi:tRNA A-37 threonylcarbamoyl transferase component Bud32/membrane-associated phospholipid phosphatase